MKFRIVFLFAILTLALGACSLASDITPPPDYIPPTPAPTMGPLFSAEAANVAAGAAIFAEKCAPCHGAKGLGDGPMAAQLQNQPTALGKLEAARAAVPVSWYTIVTDGKMNAFMPPFNAGLTDQQRWDVIAYAISLGTTGDEIARGKAVYTANCAMCHGADGRLVAKSDFTDQALMAKLSQNDIANFIEKGVGDMPALAGTLADTDIYAAAAYVRTFTLASAQASSAPVSTLEASAATPAATSAEAGVTPAETPAAATPAEATGNISGNVTNGSGGSIPTDLKAILHTFDHDTTNQQFSETATQEAPISAEGVYTFANLAMPQNRAFYVSVDYAGTTYESAPAIPQQDGKTSYDLPVIIYDTTTDTSALTADQVHIILNYSRPDLVQVVEFFIITNTGKQSIVAAEKGGPVVKISLPKGYANLQFEQGGIGDRYIKTNDGFADTSPVAPGASQYQLVFAFELLTPKPGLLGGQKLEFSQPLTIKANAVSVLVPEGVTLSGSTFTSGGFQDMNGARFQVYNATGLESGKFVDFVASGAQKTGDQPVTKTNMPQNIIVGVGAFGVALILTGAWLYWRDRKRADEADDEDVDGDGDDLEKDEDDDIENIMDSIVALDDQFKAANISEEAYRERRAELKAKLKGNL